MPIPDGTKAIIRRACAIADRVLGTVSAPKTPMVDRCVDLVRTDLLDSVVVGQKRKTTPAQEVK